jgi:hypothetical protein
MSTPIPGVRYAFDRTALAWSAPARPVLSVGGRSTLVPGTYLPSAATTGYTSNLADLEIVSGNYTPPSGAVVTRKRFQGVVFGADNVTFRDCLFEGPATATAYKLLAVMTNTSVSGVVFEDCTFRPRYNDYLLHIIQGAGYTMRRCDISRGVDTIGVLGNTVTQRADVLIEGCWLHDLAFFSPDPTHNDQMTHNDVIQWQGGAGLIVRGNRMDGYLATDVGDANRADVDSGGAHVSGNHWPASPLTGKRRALSTLMVNYINTSYGMPEELLFEDNWVNGGAVGINGLDTGLAGTLGIIRNNHFGLDWRLIDDRGLTYTQPNSYAITVRSTVGLTITGNYQWIESDPFSTSIAANTRKTTTS